MVLALLIERQRIPCGQVFDAKPIQDGLHVLLVLLGGVWTRSHVGVHRQEKVRSLMQEGGHIRLLVEDCGQPFWIEATALGLTQLLGLCGRREELGHSLGVGLVKCQGASTQFSRWCRRLDFSLLGLEFTNLRGKHGVLAFGACRGRIRACGRHCVHTMLFDRHALVLRAK